MEMVEIRWHGRGGQGAVTASKILATAALYEDKNIQAFPEYGAERAGAPVRSFTRISDEPIRVHDQIQEPIAVAVLDPTLLEAVDVTEGIKENGIILINSMTAPEEIRKHLKTDKNIKVFTVDATSISIDKLGRNIPNTTMIGALVKITGCVKLESLLDSFKNEFKSKFKEEVLNGNIEAIKTAYNEVQGE